MKSGLRGALLVLCGLSLNLFSQDNQNVHGYLVDAVCAGNHAKEPGYGAKHSNKCNLMDVCVKSGFSVITPEQSVLKFDAKGNEQALNLIKATDKENDLRVVVTGKVDGQTIAVTSIELE